jgi:hypothetical protein
MRPWDYHSDLEKDRLVKVAQLLAAGRGVALDRFDPGVGDDAWTRGVCAFNYARFQLARAAGQPGFEWLSIPDPSRRFLFRIGEIAFRFFRGFAADPAPNMLQHTLIELEQFALSFDEGVSLDQVKFRIAVETDTEGFPVQISFVAIRGSTPETIWPIPYESAPALLVSLDEEKPEGRDLSPPMVDIPDDEEGSGTYDDADE